MNLAILMHAYKVSKSFLISQFCELYLFIYEFMCLICGGGSFKGEGGGVRPLDIWSTKTYPLNPDCVDRAPGVMNS